LIQIGTSHVLARWIMIVSIGISGSPYRALLKQKAQRR